MTKKILAARIMITGAVVVATGLGTAGVASAATTHRTISTHLSAKAPGDAPGDTLGDPAHMDHGPGETPITGSTLTSVDAAAIAAVPGATVVRSEAGVAGSTGSTYEVLLRKSDGTFDNVKENAIFTVTSVQAGVRSGPIGEPGDPQRRHHGPGDTPVTGTTLTSVDAAATAAVPGTTVVRAYSSVAGSTSSTYDVLLRKADGTLESVKENASFAVTSIQSGFGPGSTDARHGPSNSKDPAPVNVAGGVNN